MIPDGKCIRLRNRNGEYLSLLPCSESEGRYDLCMPDGGILYCNVCDQLVKVLAEFLGLEEVNEHHNDEKPKEETMPSYRKDYRACTDMVNRLRQTRSKLKMLKGRPQLEANHHHLYGELRSMFAEYLSELLARHYPDKHTMLMTPYDVEAFLQKAPENDDVDPIAIMVDLFGKDVHLPG